MYKRQSQAFAALAALIALAAVQAFAAAHTELSPDEAYYLLWSRHLAWGYYDHPPMVAAWIAVSRGLFGDSPLGVRMLGILGGLAGAAASARIAWRLWRDPRVAAFAALLFTAPLLLAAGAIIATPDVPLVFFWTLGLLALAEVDAGAGGGAWLLFGLALGGACLSKFTGAFLGAGAGLALLVTPRLRPWLTRPHPYAAAALAAAMAAPFILWNAENGWVTFAKQLARVPVRSFSPRYFPEFLGAQVGLFNPLLAAVAAAGLRGSRADGGRRLLIASIAPALLYFAFHATHARVQANWLAPLYPAGIALAAQTAAAATQGWRLAAARWSAPLGIAATALAAVQAVYAPLALGVVDPTLQLVGWRALAESVAARAHEQGASVVLTQGYALTAELKLNGPAEVAFEQPDERARWSAIAPAPAPLAGPALAMSRQGTGFADGLAKRFRDVTPLAPIARARGGQTAEVYDVWRVADPIGGPQGAIGP